MNQQPTTLDDLRLIRDTLIDTARWIGRMRPTEAICRLLGHGFYPDGSRLPEWNFDAGKTENFQILHNEHIEPEGEGFAVYDGVIYGNAKVERKEEWQSEHLTQNEVVALLQYKPPLLNTALAKQVKYYLKRKSSDREIAVLSGYAEKTIQHYRLALEKASRNK